MKRTFIFSFFWATFFGFSAIAFAQTSPIASFNIESEMGSGFSGKLFIKVNGKKKKIADGAIDAWIVSGGKEIVYSGADGAGGFENEGQSLRIYDAKTGKARKILSEYTGITGLTEAKLSSGATVLLVALADGGLGASYFAVVDPKRGEIFYERFSELTEIKGDKIKLAFYSEEKWERIIEKRDWNAQNKSAIAKPTTIAPDKTRTYDLKEILKNKVIYNKTNEEIAREYESEYKDVVVYEWLPNEKPPEGKNYFLMAVGKTIKRQEAIAPLRPTLELLFAGADESSKQSGFTGATFGMKFEGVNLINGTAIVRFSQPPNQTNYGSLAPYIFQEAIERTAKQFPTVKKVVICAVGETLFDSQLENPFPRCAK